jgi:hypothetical protein
VRSRPWCAGIHKFPCCGGTVGLLAGLAQPTRLFQQCHRTRQLGSYIRAGTDYALHTYKSQPISGRALFTSYSSPTRPALLLLPIAPVRYLQGTWGLRVFLPIILCEVHFYCQPTPAMSLGQSDRGDRQLRVVEASVECLVRFTGAGLLVPFPRDATRPGPSLLPMGGRVARAG